jgi:hypothetical protein
VSVTGFKVRGLDADTDRVSIQSTAQRTHLLTRRRFPCLPAKWTTIEIDRDELIVIKCNHGTTDIEIKHLGGPHGALHIDEGGGRGQHLKEGGVAKVHLQVDHAIFVRTQTFRPPKGKGGAFRA